MAVYTVNKVAYRKHHFTSSGTLYERNAQLPVCSYVEDNTHLLL